MSAMGMAIYTRCMQNPRHDSLIRKETLTAKSNLAGGTTVGMITRHAAVMAYLDSAGVATSTRRLVLAATHAMVVVAQGTIRGRSSVQHGEENATNADAEIISQVYVMQQIKCTLRNVYRTVLM